jgi:uncharacterized protein YjbI with pentapeptide repeats
MKNEIQDFSEGEIRKAILRKADLRKINKSGKHWKGYIYIGGILVGKVKIPNDHGRIMKSSKSRFIAKDLNLNENQFNDFVNCTLTGPNYLKIIEARNK